MTPVSADEMDSPVSGYFRGGNQAVVEIAAELLVRHLAGIRGELSGAVTGTIVDGNVRRRVKESHVDAGGFADDLLEELEFATIATADDVLTQSPDVSGLYPRSDRNGRDRVVLRVLVAAKQHIELEPMEKPVMVKSRSSDDIAASSQLSRSRSHAALSAILLSARHNARFWASFNPVSSIEGTSANPIDLAANSRPWPAITTCWESMRIGFENPNSLIEAAICSTCRFGCVRALRESGFRLAVDLYVTTSGGRALSWS